MSNSSVWILAAPALPLEPSPDIKFDVPFDGTPVATSKTENGIAVSDYVLGTGADAVKGGEVEVHYTGYLTDGAVFDSSVPRTRTAVSTVILTEEAMAIHMVVVTKASGRLEITKNRLGPISRSSVWTGQMSHPTLRFIRYLSPCRSRNNLL